MLCKAGNLSKRDIGSIKIQPKSTLVEISEQKSDTLKTLAKDKKPIERHIMIKVLKKPPELTSSAKESGNRFKNRKNQSVFKDSAENTSKGFKGKRKSDRWKKIEKRSKLRNDTSKQNKDKKNNKSSKKTRVKNKQP